MTGLTLGIAAIGSIFVVLLSPVYGLIAYVAVLTWYPGNMTAKVGTVDFSASRIVAMVMIVSLLVRPGQLRKFRLILLDKLVIVFFVCQILAGIITAPILSEFLINRAGAVFDLVLPYFAVRLTLIEKQQYLKFLKYLLIIASPLALLGLCEAVTGYNVFSPLHKYAAWGDTGEYIPGMRFGFHRARVSFPVHIHFGLFFAMTGALCAGLFRSVRTNKWIYMGAMGILGMGVFASMSSGPVLAAFVSCVFIVFFNYRHYWKPALISVVALCSIVEIASNRHFYDVMGDFTMDSRTAWYRSRLMDVAFFEGGMKGHWLTGYGYGVDPKWSEKIDRRDHTDIVNHYLLILSRFGLVGFLPFFAANIVALKNLLKALRMAALESDKWLVWCLMAGMLGLGGVFFTTSLFGQPRTIYYMMLGFCGAMPSLIIRERPIPVQNRTRRRAQVSQKKDVPVGVTGSDR